MPDRSHKKPTAIFLIGTLLTFLYVSSGLIGLHFNPMGELATLVWPPSGFALAFLALYGFRLWPAVALGAFAVNFLSGASLPVALGIMAGNTLEALLGAYLMRRTGIQNPLIRLKDIVPFLLVVVICSTLVAASVGTSALKMGGIIGLEDVSAVWITWWLGDMLGQIVLGTFLLSWISGESFKVRRPRLQEVLALSLTTLAIYIIEFGGFIPQLKKHPISYLLFIPALWAALRFGTRGASSVILATSVATILGALWQFSPFLQPTPYESLLFSQLFILILGSTSLVLAAAASERKREKNRLMIQYRITRILAEAATLQEAAVRVLKTICEDLDWVVGSVWRIDYAAHETVCVDTWHIPGGSVLDEFEKVTKSSRFPISRGLPGRVWQTGLPLWIPDVTKDTDFPRAPFAAQAKLHAALAFPIRLGSQTLGVIEFFSPRIREPDTQLLEMFDAMGAQMGQFLMKMSAQATVHESEAQKTAIIESSLDAVIIMDQDGLIREFNPAASRLFGLPRAEVLGKEMAQIIIPPHLREKHREGLKKYLEHGIQNVLNRRIETTGMRSDGSFFPVELSVIRVALEGPPLFTGFLRDLTEQKKSQEALKASRDELQTKNEELEKLHQVKNSFITMVSHELKTPLAAIQEGVSLVLEGVDGPVNEEQKRTLGIVHRNITRLGRLVTNVLDFQRFDTEGAAMEFGDHDLKEIINEAAQTMEPELKRKGIVLKTSFAGSRFYVRCDADRIKQVLLNLISNAVKYTDAGHEISLRAISLPGEIRVEVADKGPGIKKEDQASLFEMFFQVRHGGMCKPGGFGVGLAVCRKIVIAHHGKIWVESAEGSGSTFLFTLPL